MRVAASLLAVALLATGCTTSAAPSGGNAPTVQEKAAPSKPAALAFNTTGEVKGENGSTLKATPRGVLYWRGNDTAKPDTMWFLVLAIRVEATDTADHVPPAGLNGGFSWKGGGRTATRMQGNLSAVPWSGHLPSVTSMDIQPGEYSDYVETLDVPEPGGFLVYSDLDGNQTRWKLPERTSGKGLAEVVKYTKKSA